MWIFLAHSQAVFLQLSEDGLSGVIELWDVVGFLMMMISLASCFTEVLVPLTVSSVPHHPVSAQQSQTCFWGCFEGAPHFPQGGCLHAAELEVWECSHSHQLPSPLLKAVSGDQGCVLVDFQGCLWMESGPTRPLSLSIISRIGAFIFYASPCTLALELGFDWKTGKWYAVDQRE